VIAFLRNIGATSRNRRP